MPWCGEGPTCLQEEDGPSRRFILPGFSRITCALQAACASQHREPSGLVRIPDLCPVHWSAAAAPCESLGGSGKCLFCVSHERKEPRGAEKHPQNPAGVEAAQNEVQSPKMTCRP